MAEEISASNVQAELCFLGALMKNPDSFVNYGNFMRSKYDFSDPAVKFFYDSFETYYLTFSQTVDETKMIFTVSMGSATGNRLLANIGPKIPLNLNVIGEVYADIETKVTEYGMNNAMIEVYIELEASTIIHMPFLSKQITVKNKIPLTMEIIQGNIPSYSFIN